MKKKVIYATIAAMALTAGLFLSQSEKESDLFSLLTENVEALAGSRGNTNCFWEDRNYIKCDNGFGLGCPCGM